MILLVTRRDSRDSGAVEHTDAFEWFDKLWDTMNKSEPNADSQSTQPVIKVPIKAEVVIEGQTGFHRFPDELPSVNLHSEPTLKRDTINAVDSTAVKQKYLRDKKTTKVKINIIP